ncbi:MAG: LD-carboxypeptidase [Ignavibacteria bacterium]|nr:LD-carboxypeptidase [Ignavibacteria bacterium]
MKPSRLQENDLIALITPASSPSKISRVEEGIKFLNERGYRTVMLPNCMKQKGYLAGSDQERIDDIHSAFSNEEVKAIISLRGGYGAGRLLQGIDYSIIRSNPKIFCGYSDLTTLQMAFLVKTGLVSFAAPMAAVDFAGELSEYTLKSFFDIVESGKSGEVIAPKGISMSGNRKGMASGKIYGGNLAVYCSMLGSEYLPDPSGKIFFFEDVSEPPYRIDRFLNQLFLNGYFEKAAGFIFGQFTEGDPGDGPTLSQAEVFEHYISKINKPVITNFPFGHVKDLYTIPFGIEVEIDSDSGIVVYKESAVI